jgi:cellulose synthase operon protein YhjU
MKHPIDPELPNWTHYLDQLEKEAQHAPATMLESGSSGIRTPTPEANKPDANKPVAKQPVELKQDKHNFTNPAKNTPSLPTKISLEMWGFYFVAKLGIYWMGIISFHPIENLVFAAFILLPARSKIWQKIKSIVTATLALVLLYYDSWLPPIGRAVSQANWLSDFTLLYLFELLTRFINVPLVASLLAAGWLYWFLQKRLNTGVLVIAGIAIVWIAQSPALNYVVQLSKTNEPVSQTNAVLSNADEHPDLDQELNNFFDKEAQRSVSFAKPAANAVPFDIIFIHICSLSWDDLSAIGLEHHPLWQHFDFLFNKFNSASSYSVPSVVHLLRATCGQPHHDNLYHPTDDNCYLMNNLQTSGFESNFALNFSGDFEDFKTQVRTHGLLTASPLPLDGLNVYLSAFYQKAPIYDDLAVLNRWLGSRQKTGNARTALYYDTITLHDGNHFPVPNPPRDTIESYKARVLKLLDEMDSFMQTLENSGRRAVVVLIPEHGQAARGDKRQIAGLREIPTPGITLVPVGIKVIGGQVRRIGEQVLIDQPTSYLAISHIIARMLEKSPFTDNQFTPSDYTVNLPTTQFVSQNEKMTVMEYNHHYYLKNNSGAWENYSEFNNTTGQK